MWFKKHQHNQKQIAFIQASGVFLYSSFVGLIMWQGNSLFGQVRSFLGPLLFVLLFCMSALICSLMVFAYPYRLFIQKKGPQAMQLVIRTAAWLVGYFFLVLALLLALR